MPALNDIPEIVLIMVVAIPEGGKSKRPDYACIVTSPEARRVYGVAVGDATDSPMHEAIRDCVERCRGSRPTGEISTDPDCIRVLKACRLLVFDTDFRDDSGPLAACKREVLTFLETLPVASELEPALRSWVEARNRIHAGRMVNSTPIETPEDPPRIGAPDDPGPLELRERGSKPALRDRLGRR